MIDPKLTLILQDVHGRDSIRNPGQTASTFGTTIAHVSEKPYLCSVNSDIESQPCIQNYFFYVYQSQCSETQYLVPERRGEVCRVSVRCSEKTDTEILIQLLI